MKNSAQKDSRCNTQKLEHDFSKSTHHTEFPITMTGKNLSATAPWRKIFINSPRNQQRMIPSTSTVIFSLVPFLKQKLLHVGEKSQGCASPASQFGSFPGWSSKTSTWSEEIDVPFWQHLSKVNYSTPPKFNMESENHPSEKEKIPISLFGVPC